MQVRAIVLHKCTASNIGDDLTEDCQCWHYPGLIDVDIDPVISQRSANRAEAADRDLEGYRTRYLAFDLDSLLIPATC
jgi:hypothetical protein